MALKPITVIRYNTLKECFLRFKGEKFINEEELKITYWRGHTGTRSFGVNVWKWLNNPKTKCWGWAEYKTKSIHYWAQDNCSVSELIELFAHEAAHLRRPRYKDKKEEEKKAARTAKDAVFAYEVTTLSAKADSFCVKHNAPSERFNIPGSVRKEN